MLIVAFEGWFQCRLPTDPDPTDEPWGITGGTFAGPGEPPLDRVIRLQDPLALRYPRTETPFGVNVTTVYETSHGPQDNVSQTELKNHPLIGAKLRFLKDAMYHQRNNIIVEGLISPIDPLVISLEKKEDGIHIERTDEWDVTEPGLTINDVFLNPTLVAHRKQTIIPRAPELVELNGIANYADYFDERRKALEELLKKTTDPTERAGLKKRIAFINETDHDIGTRVTAQQFLGLKSTYTIDINGPSKIVDPNNALAGQIGTSQDWPFEFWMGSYDVDTLCGYMKGTLQLPFHPDAA